jgi:peptidyl-dipeptidase Dcp
MHLMQSLCAAAVCVLLGPAALAAPAPNPLKEPSALPLQTPPFDRIRDSDYQPAIEEGMKQHLAEIAAIANNRSPPTFQNTLEAMVRSGRFLDRAISAFRAVADANTNDVLERVDREVAPKLAAYYDAVFLSPKLFARVKAVYDQRIALNLDPESRQLLSITYDRFVHAGAELSNADKARLREINQQLASLETEFQQRLLAAAKAGALLADKRDELAGLSGAELDGAGHAAEERGFKGKLLIPLQNTTQQPALAWLTNRATRERLFDKSWTRAEKGDGNDTRGIVAKLAGLRAEKAKLFGYPNYAAYVLYDQMAKTPDAVQSFIDQLVPPTAAKAGEEAKQIQASIDQSGEHFELKPWDWPLYAEKVRKAEYGLDERELKPYFELDRVLKNGVFYAANRLYGVSFKERHDIPVYQADVRVFDVLEKDGSQLGMIYFDYFKRVNKQGGAWMNSFVEQCGLLRTKPVVYNVANFPKPALGEPELLSFGDVTTMFHEFGHALHALFADQRYPALLDTNFARDFVEFPAIFNENWALDPEVLKHYAVHYRTGTPIPEALVEKLRRSRTWGKGYELGESLAASALDMKWHTLTTGVPIADVDAFEAHALKSTHTDFANVPPRYRSSYFRHIWSDGHSGYGAGYYAYLWAARLADDAYDWFKRNGGLTRANGERFRRLILSKGHTADYDTMFRDFYGGEPDIGPMLERLGLSRH